MKISQKLYNPDEKFMLLLCSYNHLPLHSQQIQSEVEWKRNKRKKKKALLKILDLDSKWLKNVGLKIKTCTLTISINFMITFAFGRLDKKTLKMYVR